MSEAPKPKRAPVVPAVWPQLFAGAAAAPEWDVVQQVVAASLAGDEAGWAAFAPCRALEVYTDGSAPLRNPGGPAGFAAVLVGFAGPVDTATPARPTPLARLDLGGFIPARLAEPATSNNRAEIAGVLAALRALETLGRRGSAARQVLIWSDSTYVVNCGKGIWQRKKNTDLWPIYDQALLAVEAFWPGQVALEWVKGHAGNMYNAAADEVATQAAFGFDAATYARYRAAQAASGQEMPSARALAAVASPPAAPPATAPLTATSPAPAVPAAPDPPATGADDAGPTPDPARWMQGADYTLVLHTRIEGGGLRGAVTGRWRLWAKDGRSREGTVQHPGAHAVDEAEYLTLAAALDDLTARIAGAGRDPSSYTLTLYSAQELIVKQLTGAYRVKAAALQAPFAAARAAIARFRRVDPLWKPADAVKPLFRD